MPAPRVLGACWFSLWCVLAVLALGPEGVEAQAAKPPLPVPNPVPAPVGPVPDAGAAVILLDVPQAPVPAPSPPPAVAPPSAPVIVPAPLPVEPGGAVILHDAPQQVVPSVPPAVIVPPAPAPLSREATIRLRMRHVQAERAELLGEDRAKFPVRLPWFVMAGGAAVCLSGLMALAVSAEQRVDGEPTTKAIGAFAGMCLLGGAAVIGGFIALRVTLHKRPHRQEVRELHREYKRLLQDLRRAQHERADLWRIAPRVASAGQELGLSLTRAF